MKTCKELNIKICWYCEKRMSDPLYSDYSCSIIGWSNWFKQNFNNKIIKECMYRMRVGSSLYCSKALKQYDPQLFDKLNKLIILL
jgi:hypothetical protein